MPFKPGQSGNPKGRANGSQNKITKALKEAILEALEKAGGEGGSVEYLTWLAKTNSSAFAALLGKVLPMTIADTGQNGETKFVVEKHVVWPKDKDGNIIKPSWWVDDEKDIAGVFTPRAAKISKRAANLIEDELQEFGDLSR